MKNCSIIFTVGFSKKRLWRNNMYIFEFNDVEEMYEEKNVEGLIQVLTSTKPKDVRSEAAKALEMLADPRAIPALIETLKNDPTYVRTSAAVALIEIGEPSVEALIPLIKHANDEVGELAARALGEIGDKRAVEPLIAALKDKTREVRRYAAAALGNLGDARAVDALKEAENDGNFYVRYNASTALGKIKS